mmetsp:Transcript_65682/g.154550  ORF Transcript_65682/g.154550 Transcript_65682/m.154550 type:complete len:263 (+) Transcript_65682:273-1061(+)
MRTGHIGKGNDGWLQILTKHGFIQQHGSAWAWRLRVRACIYGRVEYRHIRCQAHVEDGIQHCSRSGYVAHVGGCVDSCACANYVQRTFPLHLSPDLRNPLFIFELSKNLHLHKKGHRRRFNLQISHPVADSRSFTVLTTPVGSLHGRRHYSFSPACVFSPELTHTLPLAGLSKACNSAAQSFLFRSQRFVSLEGIWQGLANASPASLSQHTRGQLAESWKMGTNSACSHDCNPAHGEEPRGHCSLHVDPLSPESSTSKTKAS